LLAITNAVETAGHPRKFQANHGEGRARTGELIVKAGPTWRPAGPVAGLIFAG
jgi:hypothetical protein